MYFFVYPTKQYQIWNMYHSFWQKTESDEEDQESEEQKDEEEKNEETKPLNSSTTPTPPANETKEVGTLFLWACFVMSMVFRSFLINFIASICDDKNATRALF